MSKQLNVKDIPDYFTKTFQGSFLLKEITKKETKEGSKPFYSVCLIDASGSVHGIIWQENMQDFHEALCGKVVNIKSLVTQNSDGHYQLMIREMTECQEYQLSDYINGLSEDESSKYLNYLWKYINSIKDTSLQELVRHVFEGINNLEKYPATSDGHHHFSGGFLVYIISVTSMAKYIQYSLTTYNRTPTISPPYHIDLLTAASLLHAVGIVRMITPAPEMKRITCTIPLTLYEVTIRYIQETADYMKRRVEENTLNLLFHIIGYVYESDKRKPILREALILKNSVTLHNKITLLEHFIIKNQDKAGTVFDEVLGNYIYIESED